MSRESTVGMDYFAPVFLGETLSPAGAELRRFHGFIAKDSQHLAIDNRDLSSWLGCVASRPDSVETHDAVSVLRGMKSGPVLRASDDSRY